MRRKRKPRRQGAPVESKYILFSAEKAVKAASIGPYPLSVVHVKADAAYILQRLNESLEGPAGRYIFFADKDLPAVFRRNLLPEAIQAARETRLALDFHFAGLADLRKDER